MRDKDRNARISARGGRPGQGLIDAARLAVRSTVKTLYFPELWYAIESHFALALKLRNRRVLEVGFGVGMVAEAFAKSGWDATVVDPSLTALGELKGRFDRAGLEGSFEQAEPDTLPFATASFDYIVSVNMLEFSPNPNGVVREIARVLKPGGRAVIATFNRLSLWGIPAVARAVRKDDSKRPTHFLTKSELERLFKSNRLAVEGIKDRARYLPATTRMSKLPLPWTGSFVALVTKPKPKAK